MPSALPWNRGFKPNGRANEPFFRQELLERKKGVGVRMSFDCCENAVRIPALLLRADAQAPKGT
jgi:hypothetical protein